MIQLGLKLKFDFEGLQHGIIYYLESTIIVNDVLNVYLKGHIDSYPLVLFYIRNLLQISEILNEVNKEAVLV